MKKRAKKKSVSKAKKSKPVISEIIAKMQEQLINIEKKLDDLVSRGQAEAKPFDRNRHHNDRHDRGRRDRGRGERSYTKVICASCNKECEIPFKPKGDRPVYCKDCFSKGREKGKRGKNNKPFFPRRKRFA